MTINSTPLATSSSAILRCSALVILWRLRRLAQFAWRAPQSVQHRKRQSLMSLMMRQLQTASAMTTVSRKVLDVSPFSVAKSRLSWLVQGLQAWKLAPRSLPPNQPPPSGLTPSSLPPEASPHSQWTPFSCPETIGHSSPTAWVVTAASIFAGGAQSKNAPQVRASTIRVAACRWSRAVAVVERPHLFRRWCSSMEKRLSSLWTPCANPSRPADTSKALPVDRPGDSMRLDACRHLAFFSADLLVSSAVHARRACRARCRRPRGLPPASAR